MEREHISHQELGHWVIGCATCTEESIKCHDRWHNRLSYWVAGCASCTKEAIAWHEEQVAEYNGATIRY